MSWSCKCCDSWTCYGTQSRSCLTTACQFCSGCRDSQSLTDIKWRWKKRYVTGNLLTQAKCIWKCHLLKLSAANNCKTLLANLSIQAKSVDQEQTASIGAVWSGFTLFALTIQQMRKADDFCCNWHFKS